MRIMMQPGEHYISITILLRELMLRLLILITLSPRLEEEYLRQIVPWELVMTLQGYQRIQPGHSIRRR